VVALRAHARGKRAMPAKKRHIIAAADVPKVFSDAEVRRLVDKAQLPPIADLPRFAEIIRHLAESYIRDAEAGDDNAVYREVRALYFAARRRRYAEMAELIAALSPRTRQIIAKRETLPRVPWRLPDADAFAHADKAAKIAACQIIMYLLARGGEWRPGRGSRLVWHPRLIASPPQRHVPKRAAESNFILMLQLAYLSATGHAPAFTARHNALGRFPLFAIACLKLIAGSAPNTIEIINELQRRRLKLKARQLLEV
jgi:hypothetical protein